MNNTDFDSYDDLTDDELLDELDSFDDEPIEAYCVICRETVEMEDPTAVWTSKGHPGTRGVCPVCGGTVFRMGKTTAHQKLKKPEAITVVNNNGMRHTKAAKIKVEAATYIVSAATDAGFANKLSEDLKAVGVATWTDNGEVTEDTAINWAGGVHPALDQCKKLVVVLSEFGVKTRNVEEAWRYFSAQRKPIVVALAENVDPPDELRRRPRFDLFSDYKRGFRQLVQELSS